jgi:hypothetical protein
MLMDIVSTQDPHACQLNVPPFSSTCNSFWTYLFYTFINREEGDVYFSLPLIGLEDKLLYLCTEDGVFLHVFDSTFLLLFWRIIMHVGLISLAMRWIGLDFCQSCS